MTLFITGDTHGNFDHLFEYKDIMENPEAGVIVLGDAGLNFYLNKTDSKLKQKLMDITQCTWYILRGNHEARPQSIEDMKLIYDKDGVDGQVWVQPKYPRIRYFMDYGEYWLEQHRTLVIGGAYSVDKYWRLGRVHQKEENNNPKISGWFADEQLHPSEMEAIRYMYQYEIFDFILTHTCPKEWMPTDLFISMVNQDSVDYSMEDFLQKMKDKYLGWQVWLFGHYHADRLERPRVEHYFHNITSLNDIWERWRRYYVLDNQQLREWWLQKSPNYYMT